MLALCLVTTIWMSSIAVADTLTVNVNGIPTYITKNGYGMTHRAETSTTNANSNIQLTDSGGLTAWQPGYITGKWLLFSRNSYVVLSGKGYYKVRWEPEWWQSSSGNQEIAMPTVTVLSGTHKYAAEGGRIGIDNSWFRYSETNSVVQYNYVWGTYYKDASGNKRDLEWQDKYYYLDGTVKIINNERTNGKNAYYNLAITPVLYSDIVNIKNLSNGYLDVKDHA